MLRGGRHALQRRNGFRQVGIVGHLARAAQHVRKTGADLLERHAVQLCEQVVHGLAEASQAARNGGHDEDIALFTKLRRRSVGHDVQRNRHLAGDQVRALDLRAHPPPHQNLDVLKRAAGLRQLDVADALRLNEVMHRSDDGVPLRIVFQANARHLADPQSLERHQGAWCEAVHPAVEVGDERNAPEIARVVGRVLAIV